MIKGKYFLEVLSLKRHAIWRVIDTHLRMGSSPSLLICQQWPEGPARTFEFPLFEQKMIPIGDWSFPRQYQSSDDDVTRSLHRDN